VLEVTTQLRAGALDLDVAVTAAPGECLALAGPSGAGKTTVLRVAAGLRRPDAGRVRCGEEMWLDTRRGVDVRAEDRRCGYVFQEYALFPHLRAWENVAFGLHGLPRAAGRARAMDLLERFGLAGRADARPATLSGGERQRVALARALAPRPRALLLDEPLSALDARTRAAATREVAAVLREAGVPSILVTHDFGEAALLADRVAVIDAGRVVQVGAPAELAAAPASAFVADFTGAIVLLGEGAPGPDGLTAVALDGGGTVLSADRALGRVAATVFPWEVTVERPRPLGAPDSSARNHLAARVTSVTAVGSRVRVGLATPQALAAEVTLPAVRALALAPGMEVVATWKAASTRLVPL
jgi:molybdate transport system ATP-binding protein